MMSTSGQKLITNYLPAAAYEIQASRASNTRLNNSETDEPNAKKAIETPKIQVKRRRIIIDDDDYPEVHHAQNITTVDAGKEVRNGCAVTVERGKVAMSHKTAATETTAAAIRSQILPPKMTKQLFIATADARNEVRDGRAVSAGYDEVEITHVTPAPAATVSDIKPQKPHSQCKNHHRHAERKHGRRGQRRTRRRSVTPPSASVSRR
jgi:hypothetical protein